MMEPLWQCTETYVSYNDVVDKWGSASALHRTSEGDGLNRVSAAVALNIMFPNVKTTQIIKDLDQAEQSALSKLNTWKESVK